MFPDNGEYHTFPRQVLFENPELKGDKKRVPELDSSMFRYFLDGSQRSHRVMDAVFKGRYLPICAGQIGVAVVERVEDKRFRPCRDLNIIENLLAFPAVMEDDDLKELAEYINKNINPSQPFRLVKYNHDNLLDKDKDPGDLGRAKIIYEMQLLELKTIRRMIQENRINNTTWLAKDGGLQYRDNKIKDLTSEIDDCVQLRNVIGLAKTFKPSLTLGAGRKREDLGNIVKNLEWKERSTVITPDKSMSTVHGWWYVRVRPREKVYSPLQGIIKVEVFAVDSDERENGIPEERADTISGYVLNERNVTPYGADTRWASHIYPIYMAETYLRSSFLSHERFKAMIF